jgi:hypothetical protein
MLGTAGWLRDDWENGYYPSDLPEDWRLAYYANDADCVLLTADQWLQPSPDFSAALAEAPAGLALFLLPPDDMAALPAAPPAVLAGHPATLLVEQALPGAAWPQWVARGADRWVDGSSGRCLVRWWLESADLRRLRAQAETLPPASAALVLDGPAASPALLPDLRTLLDLLGRG